jgi:hypothetical protein
MAVGRNNLAEPRATHLTRQLWPMRKPWRGSRLTVALAAAVGLVVAAPAFAAVQISISQFGNDVVETATGSLDLSGLTGPGTAPTQSYTNAILANIIMGPDTDVTDHSGQAAIYAGNHGSPIAAPVSFGTGASSFIPTAVSGDTFGTIFDGFGRYLIVPHGYVSGAPISSSALFANQSLVSMGLTPGTYVFSWPSDLISIEIGGVGSAAPEPELWAMMIMGLGGAGAMLRRRRMASAA